MSFRFVWSPILNSGNGYPTGLRPWWVRKSSLRGGHQRECPVASTEVLVIAPCSCYGGKDKRAWPSENQTCDFIELPFLHLNFTPPVGLISSTTAEMKQELLIKVKDGGGVKFRAKLYISLCNLFLANWSDKFNGYMFCDKGGKLELYANSRTMLEIQWNVSVRVNRLARWYRKGFISQSEYCSRGKSLQKVISTVYLSVVVQHANITISEGLWDWDTVSLEPGMPLFTTSNPLSAPFPVPSCSLEKDGVAI